jgi:hypothetical protein
VRTFVKGDEITLNAELNTPADFAAGAVELAVTPDTPGATPVLRRILTLADQATARQPRLFRVDTTPLAAGPHVLRLTLRDGRGRSTETTVAFEVIPPRATGVK